MEDLDRFVGSLTGLALCDALGAPLEFLKHMDNPPLLTSMRPNPTCQLDKGYWTDDTAMALCSIYSIVFSEGFDLKNQMNFFLRWYRHGFCSSTGSCFDIGNTVRKALTDYELFTTINTEPDPEDNNLSNGSIMRIAPIPLLFYKDYPKAMEACQASSLSTHYSQLCADACKLVGTFIIESFKNDTQQDLVESVMLHKDEFPSLFPWLTNFLDNMYRPNIEHAGYVLTTLEVALWSFLMTDSFREGAILSINQGGDSDTYGAVYGQIAGAFYGFNHINRDCGDWINDLKHRLLIVHYAEKLYQEAVR